MIENFTLETFSPYLDGTFLVSADSLPAREVVLISASDVGKPYDLGGDRPARTPFSLLFRGARDVVLPQRIYTIEHDELGTFDIFLVPIGPDREGMRYEAIFT